jgi:predicted Zn-dependent protease
MPAAAQTVIRDSEIENYMSEWFTPIFKANGMQPSQVKIIIVQDNDVNAFVAGGSNIFFYTGLIEMTDNPGELISVMAHELGHISGGHLIRGRDAMEAASYESILGTIVGLGAAVASGDSGAVAAGSLAGGSMAQRRFLAKTRTFESSADQAAISSMNRAGMNPEGMLTFLRKLEGEELLASNQQSEYVRSHPLTRNRITTIENAVEKSPHKSKNFSGEWDEQHARMKAKLIGFINPGRVSWTYDDKDQSVAAEYARAIADYRENRIDSALSRIDGLIAREPDNPYFHELKGQMLVDFGRVEQSLSSYQTAIDLQPGSGLIRTALAHAQIESAGENKAKLEKAIRNLTLAQNSEPRSTRIHRLLATAYGRSGNDPMARLHLAEEALLQQKYSYAKQQAEIALKGLPPQSPSALRANDILGYVKNNSKN